MKIKYIYNIFSTLVFKKLYDKPLLWWIIKKFQSYYDSEHSITIFSFINLNKEDNDILSNIEKEFRIQVLIPDPKNICQDFWKYLSEVDDNKYDFIIYNPFAAAIIDMSLTEKAIESFDKDNIDIMWMFAGLCCDNIILNGKSLNKLRTHDLKIRSNENVSMEIYRNLESVFNKNVNLFNIKKIILKNDENLDTWEIINKYNNTLLLSYPCAIKNLERIINNFSGDYCELNLLKTANIMKDIKSKYFMESIILELSTSSKVTPEYSPKKYFEKEISQRAEFMAYDTFEKIISVFKDNKILKINLAGTGEPLQHPDIKKILQNTIELIENNYRFFYNFPSCLTIYTDGINLNKDIVDLIYNKKFVNIIINLDANNKEEYIQLKGSDYYDKIVDNIKYLCRKKKEYIKTLKGDVYKNVPLIAVVRYLTDDTYKPFQKFMNTWNKFSNNVKQKLKPDPGDAEIKDAFNEVYLNIDYPIEYVVIRGYSTYAGQMPEKNNPDYTPFKRFPCRKLLSSVNILTDGTISLCDRDFLNTVEIGNIKDFNNSEEILLNTELINYRELHINENWNDISLCQKCKDWYIPVE